MRQRPRARPASLGFEAAGCDSGDHGLIALYGARQRTHIDLVDHERRGHAQRVPGAVEAQFAGDAATIEFEFVQFGGQLAAAKIGLESDLADPVAHRSNAGDGDVDFRFDLFERREVEGFVRDGLEEVAFCLRPRRVFATARGWGGLDGWRQIAIEVDDAGLEVKGHTLDRPRTIDAASRLDLQRVAVDRDFLQRYFRAFAFENRADLERSGIRLTVRQRPFQPRGEPADRRNGEREGSVQRWRRLLLQPPIVAQFDVLGFERGGEGRPPTGQESARRIERQLDGDGVVIDDQIATQGEGRGQRRQGHS